MIRNIKDIDLDNLEFRSPEQHNNRHIPIRYNSERFIIKTGTVTCFQYNNEQLMLDNSNLINFINELEKKVINGINRQGKSWNINSSYKYISSIIDYDYRTVANISIFDIKPLLFDKNRRSINTDMTDFQGSVKTLLEIKDIVINDNTKVIFLYIIIHQIQFIKAEELFTQITEFAMSDDSS